MKFKLSFKGFKVKIHYNFCFRTLTSKTDNNVTKLSPVIPVFYKLKKKKFVIQYLSRI